jgi:glycosyltransferase involved in cell wall biosynthesis
VEFPKITIVTPSFNQGEFLERTIQSVLSQDYPNLEYFVLDGGSADNSPAIIEKYKHLLTGWRSHKDDGQSAAIREGFDKATGEIIAWLNSDDWYEPGTLHLIAEEFRQRQELVLVYGDYYVVRPNGTKVLKRKVSCDFNVMAYAYLMIPQPAAFWRMEAYRAVGGLNPDLRYVMDLDLFLRLAKAFPANRFLHIRKPLACFQLHPESKSVGSKEKFVPEIRRVVAQVLPPRTAFQMRVLKYLYLVKVELMYLFQRGYLPLRKDQSKA